MLNEQNSRLTETIRRQRIWNFALAGGLVIAIILALWQPPEVCAALWGRPLRVVSLRCLSGQGFRKSRQ